MGRAHGVRGEVRLKALTQDPGTIARLGPLRAADGRRIVLSDVRPAPGGAKDMLIARIDGVADRNAAESLTHVALYAPRETLAGADEPDEFLVEDLIGLAVLDEEGTVLGRIVAVPEFGAGDLLEIAPAAGGATAYLPFTEAFVPEVDIAGARVIVRPPEDMFAPARSAPDEDAS